MKTFQANTDYERKPLTEAERHIPLGYKSFDDRLFTDVRVAHENHLKPECGAAVGRMSCRRGFRRRDGAAAGSSLASI